MRLQYWKNPGPLNGTGLTPKQPQHDQFLGILSVLVQAAFSFQGMELVAMYVRPRLLALCGAVFRH